MTSVFSSALRSSLAAMLAFAALTPALADGNLQPRLALPIYQQECAACHLAYPPGLLPARSWTRIMNGLDKHYGSDASLDPADVQQISRWLQTEAGTYKRVAEAPPEDRITRSAWFVSKHRKLDPQVWKHASVKSAANCAACHAGADKGDFDDDGVTLPYGLSKQQFFKR
jgi:mono/diheme cytochrome c family protein